MSGINLKFAKADGTTAVRGPFPRIRLEGEVIRAAAGGPVIARHENHVWMVDGEAYTRLDCDCTVRVHFERVDGSKSRVFGPVRELSFLDGVAFLEHEIFAFADRSIVDWYCHADGVHWPLMVVEAAD